MNARKALPAIVSSLKQLARESGLTAFLKAALRWMYYVAVTMPANAACQVRAADKLMIVAHPDDETLFFSRELMASSGWLVLCCTNGSRAGRARGFRRAGTLLGFRTLIWNYADGNEVEMDADRLSRAIRGILEKQEWTVVATHNQAGEYGHFQHRQLHRLVAGLSAGKQLLVPADSEMLESEANRVSPEALARKREVIAACYGTEADRLSRLERYVQYEATVSVAYPALGS